MVNFDYLYNPEAAKSYFDKDYFLDKKLGFRVIEQGTILPHKKVVIPNRWHFGLGGIVDRNGNFIEASSLHRGTGGAYNPPQESICKSSETVIYLAMFYRVWGHDLTDNIRRVWFLKSEFMHEFKSCPIVYIPYDEGNFTLEKQPSLSRLLEILEVDLDNVRPIMQPTQFDKIILPDDSFCSTNNKIKGFTKEYRETIDRVRDFAIKNRTPTSNKKIYFFNGRKGIREERLSEYFKQKGYEIVRPEKLPLDEQLNLLINAENFASVGCSCAHNSLFLREGAEMIFIPRTASKFGSYQEVINQVRSLNINYIDSTLSLFSNSIANVLHFYMISPQLKKFFGDKCTDYEEEDFKNFLQYVKKSLEETRTFYPHEEYYGKFFADFMAQLKQHESLIAACDMPTEWEEFKPTFNYQTHIASKGWSKERIKENGISNPLDQKLDVQAIKISYPGVYYSVYYNAEEGWSEEVTTGEMAGTTGKSRPIYGMRARFDEAGAEEFDILYRMHKFDGTWTAWAKNGEVLYSHGQKLNAIQIKREPINLHAANESDNALLPLEKHDDTYLHGQDVTKF